MISRQTSFVSDEEEPLIVTTDDGASDDGDSRLSLSRRFCMVSIAGKFCREGVSR